MLFLSHTHKCLCVIKAQQEDREKNYMDFLATEELNLIPNNTEIDCPICFCTIQPGEGVVLRECLHAFCRSDMLKESVALAYAVKQVHAIHKILWFIFQCGSMCTDEQRVSKRDNSEQSRCWGVLSRGMWKPAAGPGDQSGDLSHFSTKFMQKPSQCCHYYCRFTAIAASEWRGTLAFPRAPPEDRRKPRRSQLPLSDSKLPWLVYLRGRRERVPLPTLRWKQLHSVPGRFLLCA